MNTTENQPDSKEVIRILDDLRSRLAFDHWDVAFRNALFDAITLLQNKEKDTDRLDWLEQNTGDHANPSVFTAWNLPSTLREAIDTAIAAQQEAESA